ncbi:ChaC-like protein-domain-containing protein [Triangularia verruculosa]|uniref:glutathione-specific gamma-glutamylcyclotransferase n=1 Tax=Triangularia verruculosa TaxID=2587418 RepID=A0AAN6XJ47_9PEZI|nr:ChaC-like protein-domain-containing protein [Triangularia verruculosa]
MSAENAQPEANEFWLFGYGSLIWKPPPHFDRRIPGWVTGYVRRFWQASEDHRGTPEAPGRVVTLISREYWEQLTDHHDSAPEKVWGVAYRIIPERVAEVKEYLDIREINGYTIHYTPFHAAPSINNKTSDPLTALPKKLPIQTLVYIGTPENEQFVGPQDHQKLAEHIYRSKGPSGLNRDYLWGLEQALNELSPESGDEHVTDLSDRVRAVATAAAAGGKEGAVTASQTDKEKQILRAQSPVHVSPEVSSLERQHEQQHHHHHEFRKVSSIDEQEETEKAS